MRVIGSALQVTPGRRGASRRVPRPAAAPRIGRRLSASSPQGSGDGVVDDGVEVQGFTLLDHAGDVGGAAAQLPIQSTSVRLLGQALYDILRATGHKLAS